MKADKAKEKTARETKVRCESSGKSGGQKGGNFVDEEMTLTAVQHEEGQIAFRLAHLRLTLHATLIAAAALLVILGLLAYYISSLQIPCCVLEMLWFIGSSSTSERCCRSTL
jgi:hypothetical protein